jgi:hypothetical protein
MYSSAKYNRLALLAYVILWDLEPAHRLHRALRIVRRSVPWRESDRSRRRVLKRAIRTPRSAVYRPRGRLRMSPVETMLDPGLAEAIRRLGRAERAAYVLQRVNGRSPEQTAAELRGLRVHEPDAVAGRAVHSVDAETELDPDEQRAAILALNWKTVAVSPRWSPWPARTRLAALLAGVLAMIVTGVLLWWPEERTPLRVNARAGADITYLKEWPIRGDLVHDRALLARAQDAWEGVPDSPGEDGVRYGSVALYGLREVPHPRPGPGTLVALFAGTVEAGRSVLLSDGDLYALYSEGTGHGRSLTVEAGANWHRGPLSVSPPPYAAETRTAYLLPPDTVGTEVATLADARPAWRPVTPRNGIITMPEPGGSGRCQRTLFRLSLAPLHSVPGITWVFTDLRNPVTTTQIEWTSPGDEVSDTTPVDTRLVRDAICDHEVFPHIPERSVRNIGVEPFWRGTLPEAHHQGTFVSLGISYGRGQPIPPVDLPITIDESRGLFVDQPPGTPGTAQIVAREADDEGGAADTTYATASWHAPSGRWYLIAGGASAIARMRAWGKRDEETDGHTLILRGPKNHAKNSPEWDIDVDAETRSGEPGIPL